jgi:hypothetical protein
MHAALLLAALTLAGPPVEPSPEAKPFSHWWNGTGMMAIGGTLKGLGFAAGVWGIVTDNPVPLAVLSIAPSWVGGNMMVIGAWMWGRHQAAYRAEDLSFRVRPARRIGWSLAGLGGAAMVGATIGLTLMPFYGDPHSSFGGPLYPGLYAASNITFVTAPLLIGVGASALTWSDTYSRARTPRVEIQPTAGGLSVRF